MKEYMSTEFVNNKLKILSSRLKQARQEAGLGQKKVQANTGIDYGYLSKIENGKHLPSVPTLLRLAEEYGKDPGWFFEE